LDGEKLGVSFNERVCREFNSFLDELELMELRAIGRKFTWSNSTSTALLDRFLCSVY
jgi:hypothetical protein